MIDLKQIMQDLPVQNFTPKNFVKFDYGFSYKVPSVQCEIEQNMIRLYWNTLGNRLYISLTERTPEICYWADDPSDDWGIDLKICTKSDLFQQQIMIDMFGLDMEFVEYSKQIYLKVLKEFYPWKYQNPFEK